MKVSTRHPESPRASSTREIISTRSSGEKRGFFSVLFSTATITSSKSGRQRSMMSR